MTAGKINSNTFDAEGAVKELTGITESDLRNESVNFGSSNVPSMLAGQTLTNQLMNDVSKVVSCVLIQANKFPELARAIEERDMDAARRWS